jgi:leader peptidase (prepilin peptidase)/N-methyltransferase
MLHYYIFSVLFGLVLGSFMNVLIYRVPRGISIVTPGSHCPKCGNKISWYSNIPVASFLVQRGKCARCGGKISWQYPLVEFITAVVFLSITIKYGASLLTLKYCVFAFFLLAGGFTDVFTAFDDKFECGVIPTAYIIGGVSAGYFFAFLFEIGYPYDIGLMESFAGSGIGAFSLYIPSYLYAVIRKREGMGDGDALFMAMAGSFLGALPVLFIFTVSAFVGLLFGVAGLLATKNKYVKIPFAAAIAVGAIVSLLTGSFV